jgi:hypothetical protein
MALISELLELGESLINFILTSLFSLNSMDLISVQQRTQKIYYNFYSRIYYSIT